jgi:hypothetical protein
MRDLGNTMEIGQVLLEQSMNTTLQLVEGKFREKNRNFLINVVLKYKPILIL